MESAFDEEFAGRGQYMLPPRRRAGSPHSCDRIVFCHHTSLVDCSERMGSVREVLPNRLRSEAVMAAWCCSTSPRRPAMTRTEIKPAVSAVKELLAPEPDALRSEVRRVGQECVGKSRSWACGDQGK